MKKLTVKAKTLKHQISFLENISSSEIEQQKWQSTITTYAEIKPLHEINFHQIDSFNFGHVTTEALFIFRLRFIPDIISNMRIMFGKRTFAIKRIINLNEDNQILQILALELGEF